MRETLIKFKAGVTDCFIIGDRKKILIDTGIRMKKEDYENLFEKENIDPKDIVLVVITHGHIDHFAHLREIKTMTGAGILCHKKAVHPLKTGISAPVIPANIIGKILKAVLNNNTSGYLPVDPDITIEDDFDLKDFGVDGKIVPTPGHTDCSLSVIIDSGFAITGDMFMPNPFNTNKPLPAIFITDKKKNREMQAFLLV